MGLISTDEDLPEVKVEVYKGQREVLIKISDKGEKTRFACGGGFLSLSALVSESVFSSSGHCAAAATVQAAAFLLTN